MAATPEIIFNIEDHSGKEICNFSVEKLAVDPSGAGLYEGRVWENTTTGRLKGYLNATSVTFASLADIHGLLALRGVLALGAAATVAAPTVGIGVDSVLMNGYVYRVGGAAAAPVGTSLTGLTPIAAVDNGDFVVFTGADNTAIGILADWSSFSGWEGEKVDLSNASIYVPPVTQALTVDTDAPVTMTGLTSIDAYEIVDSTTGANVKSGLFSKVVGNVITVNSGVAMTVKVTATGH